MMIQTDPHAIVASHQLLARYNYLEELQFSGIPITIIQTPYDMDINRSIQQYKSQLLLIKAVDFQDIPGAGHIVNMEKPEIYNNLLAKILT